MPAHGGKADTPNTLDAPIRWCGIWTLYEVRCSNRNGDESSRAVRNNVAPACEQNDTPPYCLYKGSSPQTQGLAAYPRRIVLKGGNPT